MAVKWLPSVRWLLLVLLGLSFSCIVNSHPETPLQLLQKYLQDFVSPGERVKSVPKAAEEGLFQTLLKDIPLTPRQFAGECSSVYDANGEADANRYALLLAPKSCVQSSSNATTDDSDLLPAISDLWQVSR